MKKVVKTTPKSEITEIDKVRDCLYYGAHEMSFSNKGFITQSNYCSGLYRVMAKDAVTKGNGWSPLSDYRSLKGVIEAAINRGFDVFEFDTAEELFAWLAKKD